MNQSVIAVAVVVFPIVFVATLGLVIYAIESVFSAPRKNSVSSIYKK